MPCTYQQGVEAGQVGLGEDLGVEIPVLPLEYILQVIGMPISVHELPASTFFSLKKSTLDFIPNLEDI